MHHKRVNFLLLCMAVALNGCNTINQPSSTPTATTIPTLTPTLVPTITPTLPPSGWTEVDGMWVSPEFITLQEKIAESQNFALTLQGLETIASDGTTIVIENVTVNPDGKILIIIDGQELEVTAVKVGENTFRLITEDGKTWIWDGIAFQEEILEFVPADTIEFVEELPDYKLRLHSLADPKAIYWDVIVSHIGDVVSKSGGMEFNRTIYEEMIKDHPEWSESSISLPYKERIAFMKDFLTRSGGRMVITDMRWNKYEVDFNLPIKFEVLQVNELPKEYENALGSRNGGEGGGFDVYSDENGQMICSIAIVQDSLEYMTKEQVLSMYYLTHWREVEVISDLFLRLIVDTASHTRALNNLTSEHRVPTMTNYELYIWTDFYGGRYYLYKSWTFIAQD